MAETWNCTITFGHSSDLIDFSSNTWNTTHPNNELRNPFEFVNFFSASAINWSAFCSLSAIFMFYYCLNFMHGKEYTIKWAIAKRINWEYFFPFSTLSHNNFLSFLSALYLVVTTTREKNLVRSITRRIIRRIRCSNFRNVSMSLWPVHTLNFRSFGIHSDEIVWTIRKI